MTSDAGAAAALAALTSKLQAQFPSIPVSTVHQVVTEIHAGFDGCRVRQFIPLLVERESRDLLRALVRQSVNGGAHGAGHLQGGVKTSIQESRVG